MKLVKTGATWIFFAYYYLLMALMTLSNAFKRFLGLFREAKPPSQISPFQAAHPYVFSSVDEVVSQDGFTFKTYTFQTEDRASITMWRIHKEDCQFKLSYPVLLMHGLLDCSVSWFMHADKNQSLPYILAAKGYDVWVGNNRGNRICEENSNKVEEDYCLDHLVEHDQPAIINKIILETGKEKIIYIGHSQGSTQFLLGTGLHPLLANKIATFIGLGTVLSMEHLKSHPVLDLLDKFFLLELANIFGFKRILRLPRALTQATGALMSNCKVHNGILNTFVQLLCGTTNNFCDHLLGGIIAQGPGGASAANTLQWVQCYRNGKMRKLCHGKLKNKQVYGSEEAPTYCLNHLSRLPFETHLFRGLKDAVISDGDFKKMVSNFKAGSVSSYELANYNHLDYLWGVNAHKDVYEHILRIVQECSSNSK